MDNVNQIHSLNIDSTKDFLFPDIFNALPNQKFSVQFVDNRIQYYDAVKELADDQDGLFYVVGSDEFLQQNIEILRGKGINPAQIVLDKHPQQRSGFLPEEI